MRITTNMVYDRNISSLNGANERLSTAYEQLMTGNKFKTAGEDPSGMSQKLALTKEIDLFKQYGVNGSLLENSLGHEETVLTALNTAMTSAQTLIQKANDSAVGYEDRQAIASELEGLQKQMFDLMNSKNSQGEYIFGGNQSKTQPFIQDASGNYVFQGDTGQRNIQVSPTVQIPANDSGFNLFEIVPTRRTSSAGSANIQVGVADQGHFDSFYRNNYDPSLASNQYTVNTIAGTPDTYEIRDGGGALLQSGDYVAGNKIPFNGLELTLSLPAGGASQNFVLDPPQNNNILDGMSDFITALRDPNITPDTFQLKVADATAHMKNARLNVDQGLGEIGGRMNGLEQVMGSNEGLSTLNQQARAKVSEADLYEVIATLSKEDAALSATQLSFSKISKLTLFDYIR
ncbi:flagellar hook-associated protein 3 [Aeromonas hydrophila]|uniref:flagellar hook-associated protein FlgL n=1 Tax=Aeromonas hydrophila TaxID=644 RepID=UPI001A1C5A0E|nr:flagellar hook-associated protein FlgL [Aeromonas hydrophila]EHA1066574.1 flagellar hook-associated protein 3 [Aeromonas hydrophila]EIS3743677.1 flagellar hook-associated protein FlgL [Aeromonas hydrophila]MCO4209716.1 flagellar hook-associated protein FlgL [Aeromonas hydrophila]MDD9228690.1 flagellar hook-associated protein FlgL [Aeromonas hydrophila]HAT1549634.1 flagellar hook-associated protein 3 [Aeromonas hydrophila]